MPTNTLVQVLFNKPISATSLGQVTLKLSGSPVPVTNSLINGDTAIQLTPSVPLSASTAYTISVTGVTDVQGKATSGTSTNSFTTSTGIDLTQPSFVSVMPASGATSVPTNATVKVMFSKAMDPISFNPSTTLVLTDPNGVMVPATITLSTDLMTATLHPTAALNSATTYTITWYYGLTDLSGNTLYQQFSTTFTTQ